MPTVYFEFSREVMKFLPIHRSRGLTLIELVIVIAIIGILAGYAGPNFSTFLAERSIAAETRRVIGALKLARSEARSRGATVTLSRPNNQDWTGSIDIYVDVAGANQARNGADDLIRQEAESGRSINAIDDQDANDPWISFNVKGWLAETNPVLIAVCSPGLDVTTGMYIAINRVGKIRERSIRSTDIEGCNP